MVQDSLWQLHPYTHEDQSLVAELFTLTGNSSWGPSRELKRPNCQPLM